jgi:hypothetical protein
MARYLAPVGEAASLAAKGRQLETEAAPSATSPDSSAPTRHAAADRPYGAVLRSAGDCTGCRGISTSGKSIDSRPVRYACYPSTN